MEVKLRLASAPAERKRVAVLVTQGAALPRAARSATATPDC